MSEWNHSETYEPADQGHGTVYEPMRAAEALDGGAPYAMSAQGVPVYQAKKASWVPMIAGTIAILVGGGVLWQVFRAEGLKATTGTETAQGTPVQTQPASQALAKVNDTYISYDQVAAECFARIGQEVLENLINRTLIQQEVQKRGIVISEAEVNQEVTRIAEEFKIGVDSWYQMLATERGVTPEQYKRDIIWPKLALEKLAGKNIEITKQDMDRAFVRDYGPRVKCSMIMVDNIRRGNEVWEKAMSNPNEFEALAREHSIDPNSRALGGQIPPIRKYAGNEDLEREAFNLKPGQISKLIQIDVNRFIVLRCDGFTDPIVTDMNEVYNILYSQLQKEKTQERVATIFEDIRKTSRIDNYLTNTSTGGPTNPIQNPIQQTGGQRQAQGGAAAPVKR